MYDENVETFKKVNKVAYDSGARVGPKGEIFLDWSSTIKTFKQIWVYIIKMNVMVVDGCLH